MSDIDPGRDCEIFPPIGKERGGLRVMGAGGLVVVAAEGAVVEGQWWWWW